MNQNPLPFHSAFITLVGRPNSGKSTLINSIIGEEIAIVSALPQTTRSNARGIYTTDSMQLIFIDTPGLHIGNHTFNRAMLQQVHNAVKDSVDLICYIVDLSRTIADEETTVAELVRSVASVQRMVIFNKIDLVSSVEKAAAAFYQHFPDLAELPSIQISAMQDSARQLFLDAVTPFVPEGPRYFDPDDLSDSTMRYIAAEYIRKQIINFTGKEVPHAVYIEIESYKELQERHTIIATIHVETRGQRGIIVGKGGAVISRIKRQARKELQQLTGIPVSLTCHVKVSPRWRDNRDFLTRMGVDISK